MSQERIWEYFQNEGVDVFSESRVRLEFLFRKARKAAGGTRPKALNIGAGNGWLEERCMGEGWETYSLDPGAKVIERLVERGIAARVGRMESIPFESGSFDVVFCSEVIEHLSAEQTEEGLREVRRVLKESGVLVGSVPYREDLSGNLAVCPECGQLFHRWGHMQSFDREKLTRILSKHGFATTTLGTRSFLDFSKGTLRNRIGLSLHWMLGRVGIPLADPSLYFVARKAPGRGASPR